jgi:hypothetical protein
MYISYIELLFVMFDNIAHIFLCCNQNNLQRLGSKCYTFAVGDKVLKRNSKNISRKGGKMDALWLGSPYYVIELIKGQCAYLSSMGVTAKKAVSLLQLKPYLQAEPLHSVEGISPCHECNLGMIFEKLSYCKYNYL